MRRTKTSLHNALIGLAREKPYPSIAVKEILDRANVGRSTFYTHFRDKDDLLESGIQEILRSTREQSLSGRTGEQILAFSLPVLMHIDEHRRAAGPTMKREGRVIMHRHLQQVLTTLIADELARMTLSRNAQMPRDLIARHVASTFVLVLNWWVDSEPALTAETVDVYFRNLVAPAVTKFSAQFG